MPRGRKKKISNITEGGGGTMQELTSGELHNVSGGAEYGGLSDLTRMRVKCLVEGCNFECNTFHELNVHMKSAHPERC